MSDTGIRSYVTGNFYRCRNAGSTCRTGWAVYVIACSTCGMQYTGSTNNLRLRMNNHKSSFSAVRTGGGAKTNCHRLYEHLVSCNSEFKFQVVESFDVGPPGVGGRGCGAPDRLSLLRERETDWMYRLDTLAPLGLNIDDGTYSQNRSARRTSVKT